MCTLCNLKKLFIDRLRKPTNYQIKENQQTKQFNSLSTLQYLNDFLLGIHLVNVFTAVNKSCVVITFNIKMFYFHAFSLS